MKKKLISSFILLLVLLPATLQAARMDRMARTARIARTDRTIAPADDNTTTRRTTIRGKVVDETGMPLPGASVSVAGTAIGAGTNTQGEFILTLTAEEAAHTLRASFIGYQPTEYTLKRSERNNIVLRLAASNSALDEVVVTGTRTEKPLKDVPVLTRVIGQQEIRKLNPMDMETLLQYELPGIQFSYNAMSQLPEVKYQGMDAEYLLFLVDGERISGEGADQNVDFSRFNIDDIERIEVVRGAQSTLYGSNALGGVINIITRGANRPFTGNVNARYGDKSGQKYSVSAGTKQSRFSTFTSLTHRNKATYTITDTEGAPTTSINPDGTSSTETSKPTATTIRGYQIWDASQKLGYAFTDRLSAEVKGTYYHNKRDNSTPTAKVNDLYSDYAVNGRVKYLFDINHQLEASYLYDHFAKDLDYFQAGYTKRKYANRTQTARVNYTGQWGERHTLTAGMETNAEYLKHYMFKDSAAHSLQYYVLYLQEDWRVTDQLNLVAGVRADYHSKYALHVTPKLSVMYKPTSLLTLRAGYAQGFRSPTLKELYEEYDMGGIGLFMYYGNPDLQPETSNQFSLSGEVTKGIFYASLSGYYNRFNKRIVSASMGNTSEEKPYPDMIYLNSDGSKSIGVEAIARLRFDWGLAVQGAYAFVDDYEAVRGHNLSTVRPHSLTFNASYQRKLGKVNTSLTLNGQWTSKLSTYSLNTDTDVLTHRTYDPRTLCSLNASAGFPRGITVGVGIDNLLNYKDRSVDAGIQLPQQGIGFIGTLSINLADLFKL